MVIILAGLLAWGAPARADELARLENILLTEQLLDVVTTQEALRLQ